MPGDAGAGSRPHGIPARPLDPDPDEGTKVEVILARRRDASRRWAARQLHRAGVDLAVYYGPRPLRAVPLVELLAEGRWASAA
jgi:hypothetical protein